MAADVGLSTFDRETLNNVARLAAAELAPAASIEGKRPGRQKPSPDGVAGAADGPVLVEVRSSGGISRVTEGELSRAIEAALSKTIGRGELVVLRSGSEANSAIMRKLVERLPSLVEARRQHLMDRHIDALVDAYLPADALASVMPDIEADNAKAQADFLKTYPTLTADQIAERAGHAAANRSATANRWKGERKIFSVRAHGREVYPAFQFESGRPKAALRSALEALGGRSGWQTAFWFVTPNGWLGGVPPIERLDDAASLSAAASHEAEAWIG